MLQQAQSKLPAPPSLPAPDPAINAVSWDNSSTGRRTQ